MQTFGELHCRQAGGQALQAKLSFALSAMNPGMQDKQISELHVMQLAPYFVVQSN